MWLSNSLYLLLTVAFIEMCRALLPLFVMTSLYLTGLETPTATLVKAVALTGLGCLISAYGEVCVGVGGGGGSVAAPAWEQVWECSAWLADCTPFSLTPPSRPRGGVCEADLSSLPLPPTGQPVGLGATVPGRQLLVRGGEAGADAGAWGGRGVLGPGWTSGWVMRPEGETADGSRESRKGGCRGREAGAHASAFGWGRLGIDGKVQRVAGWRRNVLNAGRRDNACSWGMPCVLQHHNAGGQGDSGGVLPSRVL